MVLMNILEAYQELKVELIYNHKQAVIIINKIKNH
jgi:hypothetical protein